MVNLTTFLVDLIIFYLVWANKVITFRNYMYITSGHKFIFLKKLSQSCSSYIWNVCLTPKLKCNPSIGTEAVLVNRKSSKAQQLKGLVWTEFILLMNWAYVFCKKSKFSYNIHVFSSIYSFSSFSFLDNLSYLLFNFNDYPSGMVTLFNLLVMGNWQVWMQVWLIHHLPITPFI